MRKSIFRRLTAAAGVLVAANGLNLALPDVADAGRQVNNNTRTSVNRNTNVNVNRSVDVDVDVDRNWHPVATAAAVTATVAVTSAMVGSIVHSIPPSCVPVVISGMTYQQCGSTWYQPQYVGSSVQYVVIAPPR
jgi:hypothetical protein